MIDARPFLKLQTPSQARAGVFTRVLRPEIKPLTLGITGGTNGVAVDSVTHTIMIPLTHGTPPADLVDGVTVTVDVELGKPREAFTVLRNGIDKGAGLWTLYVRREDGYVAPVVTDPDQPPEPATDGGYWGNT